MRTVKLMFILTILGLLPVACHSSLESEQEQIYSDIINETVNNIAGDFSGLDPYNEVLVNPFDDHLDSIVVAHAINDTSRQTHPRTLDLLNKLKKILNNRLSVDFSTITEHSQIRLISNEDTIGYNYHKKAFKGLCSISNVATNEEHNAGVFYVDFQLGKDRGGAGYLVFVTYESDKWRILTISREWGTPNWRKSSGVVMGA